MEGQKRPRVFLQKRYNTQKRFLALMLAFAMIFTSVGTDLNVAYAAEGNRVDFEIYGADLVEAINDAVETQSPVTADDLNFTNGAIEKFDALFFGEGKVYEVFPPVEGGDMDAEVRVFVRLPEDADDMYMVTGDEEVIFLYINNGEDTISCSTKIIRTVDGEEKVKSTKRITVKSYEDKFGEEESNIISKPEETLPAVPETSAPESQPEETPAETLNPAETTAPEETTIPESTEAPDGTEESSEIEETTEAPESTEAQETETSEETKEEVTEAETEATEAEKEETEAVEETEEPEAETDEEKSQDDSAVTLSSISRHQVPVVAVKEDAEPIETEEVSETEAEEETEKETEETEAEETEKETTAAPEKETTAAEETTSKETTAAPEESTEATEETSTEAESSEEATESEEATTAPETQETEETTEAETEVPAETETTAPAETETQPPVQPATPAEPEEGNKPAATDTDLVGMGWCSTAKAYTRTLNELRALEDIPGYKVTYAINPEYSARIVDGPRGVEEGETLVFGVKNQIGYAVESVVVNGEVIEADTTEDNEDGSKTVWYSVPEVMGEMDVEVVMTENGNHPAVTLDSIEVDGVTIQISAEEGVLPEGVTATAARVNQDVEATVADRMTEDGKAISSVMAFDINLWLGDQLLDSEIWGGSQKVTVTFSGQPIEENAAAADTVETVYVETVYDGNKAAKEQVANEEIQVAATDVTNVIPVSDEIDTAEAGISAVSFEAEHFSIYALVGSTWYKNSYEMYQGQTIRLYAYDTWGANEGTWSVSSDNVQLGNHGYDKSKDAYYTDITAVSATQSAVTVTYKYRGFFGGTSRQTFSIRVNNGQKEETAYFYVLRPGKDAGSLLDESWLYVGKGKINASGLKNQNGNPMEAGQGHYSNDVDGRVISYPDENVIKQRIAESYGVSIKDVQIGYAPFKISYPNGWKDENDNGHDDKTPCYHVDMTVSITTKNQASVTYHLSDAGVTGYTVLGSYMVDKGSSVSVPSDISQQCPDKKGDYYFDGWYTNPERTGDKVVFPYLVNEGTDFYAKYVYSPEITIRYEAVGGGSVTAASETVRVTDPESAVKGSAAVETSGYVFKGWYDNQAGNGSPLSIDRSFKPVKSPLGWEAATYYAVFTKIEQTEITGPYVEIKDSNPNNGLYYQGEVNVEVYLDGTLVAENSGTVKFGYEQYACVDLKLTYIKSNTTVANAVYAIQVEGKTNPKPITEDLVDNVKDGSTVYIYLSSVYGVNYVVNGDVVGIEIPADNNKYTIPSSSEPSGEGYSEFKKDLSSYKTENVTIEALPVKSGVTFSDWKDTEEQTHAAGSNWSLSNAIGTANKDNNVITLTTTPTDNTYTVHYQTNGGSAVADKTVGWDDAKLSEKTSRTGYDFGGWYTDPEFTSKYQDSMSYGDVAGNDTVKEITLYAKWKAGISYYTVDIIYQDPDTGVFGNGVKEIRWAKTGDKVLITPEELIPERDPEHYVLDTTQSILSGVVAPDGTTKLKVVFKLQYTVNFYNLEGNTTAQKPLKTEKVDWGGLATAPNEDSDSSNDPSRQGYDFAGWDKKFNSVTKDTDVFAKWTPAQNVYKVKYIYQDPETGLFDKDVFSENRHDKNTGEMAQATVDDKTPDPSIAGSYVYVLDESKDNRWNIPVAPDGGTVLEVYFKLQFKVNFWLTEQHNDGILYDTKTVDWNGNADVPDPNPSRTGYTFEKWEGSYTNVKSDTDVHAIWKENEDVRISYSPDDAEHGNVSPAGENVAPATGNPAGSTATAKDGWAFKHWMKDGEIVSWERNLSKEVIDANSKDANDLYVESGYVAVFGEDKNKDNIPDDLQIVFTYVADNNGTLKGTTSEYHNKYKVKADGTLELGSDGNPIPVEGMINPEVNVTTTPSTGYKFDSWTDSNNNTYNTTDALKAAQYAVKDETFTAHFTKDEFAYKVYKHYENAETVVAKEGTGTFGENILSVSGIVLADAEDYNGHHYILEKVDGKGSVITANVDSNRVDIYYVLDEKGGTDPTDPTNPNRPDGVADKYQTVFKYVSAGNGSVTGTTYEVHTFKENGKYTEASKMPVSPKAEVSVTPADKYAFDYWTIDESQKDYSSEMVALKSQKYNQDTTFVVHFDTDGNGDRIPDKYQVIVSYEAVNGTVTITEPVYVTLYKDGHYATPEEGGAGKLEADQIADASPLDGFDPSTEQWKANDKAAEKPTTETQITENTKYVVTFGKNGYVYDVVKRYLDVNGNLVDEIVTSATALYGENILEVSGVTVLQEEVFRDEFYELVSVDGADRLITSDLEANHVEIVYQQKEYGYDVVKRFLNAAGEEVDAVTKLGTALYGDNILEVSKVTTEQEELYKDNLYELVEIKGADLLITNDIQANHVEVIYQQKEYGYDVVKRFLNAAGEEVDAVAKLGTAAYGTNILEASDVTVLQEELHNGNLYELVKVEGADLLISNDIQANHVEVIYQQKEYGYDVVKRFLNAAGEEVDAVTKLGTAAYGTNILEASDVTVLQEELHNGNLYELVKVEGADLLISNDIQANHVEIIYQQKNYNYEVVKHYEGLNETAVESTKGTAPYGTGILEMSNVDVLQHETYKEHTYVLTKVDGADKLITNDETQNRVDIYYVLDEKGGTDPTDPTNPDKPDGHPDKYQIIFRYVSADEAMGTVSVTEAEVHTFTDDAGNYVDKKEISPDGATAQALEGFAFDYWADTEGRDYTADMQNMKSQTYLEDTTFTAHFAEDKIGTDPTDPNKPDNVPDNRQITFRYVSENPSYGTVSGTVVEVRTIMEVAEGEKGYQVLETKSVNPFAEVTVSANGRYRFERWSDGTTNFANADEISAASYSADAVFTAYFNYYSGGGSGGGGGGNGGGPSGSGGDSSRGPGVTVTIDNPDVPLAPAPETGTGDVISINDGMVPMAPLPKTGQTTMRSTLLMAFSGILLAITGFSKKRKEEEN